MTRGLNVLYQCMKFRLNICNGYQVIERTRFCDGQTDRQTDIPTFIFFLSILHVKKYPITQKVPNNTLDFYGLNRIFNVCCFP